MINFKSIFKLEIDFKSISKLVIDFKSISKLETDFNRSLIKMSFSYSVGVITDGHQPWESYRVVM